MSMYQEKISMNALLCGNSCNMPSGAPCIDEHGNHACLSRHVRFHAQVLSMSPHSLTRQFPWRSIVHVCWANSYCFYPSNLISADYYFSYTSPLLCCHLCVAALSSSMHIMKYASVDAGVDRMNTSRSASCPRCPCAPVAAGIWACP